MFVSMCTCIKKAFDFLCVNMYACMCVCMFMYLCMYVYTYIYTRITHTHTHHRYVVVDVNGYQHPYEEGAWVSKRVYLRALRDIKAGEELFVSYGSTYHTIHF